MNRIRQSNPAAVRIVFALACALAAIAIWREVTSAPKRLELSLALTTAALPDPVLNSAEELKRDGDGCLSGKRNPFRPVTPEPERKNGEQPPSEPPRVEERHSASSTPAFTHASATLEYVGVAAARGQTLALLRSNRSPASLKTGARVPHTDYRVDAIGKQTIRLSSDTRPAIILKRSGF